MGLSWPEPSKKWLSGPEPSKRWLSGPEPSKRWLSGPEPSKRWLSGPEPSKRWLSGPEPSKRWLSGSEPNKKVLLTPEPYMRWLIVSRPNKEGQLGPETRRERLGPVQLKPRPPGMDCKPWFKDRDRLPSHYLAKSKNRFLKCPTSLDSRRWIFLKEGLDDFRTGCPSCENIITRGHRESFLPTIAHRIPRPPPKRGQNNLPKGADLCSKLSLAQQARKAFVESIEASLIKHPLARYPNLEKSLPADLLLKVLQVLDPDRKLEDTWAYCLSVIEGKQSINLYEKHLEEINLELSDEDDLESPREVDLEPPGEVDLEPPGEVDLESPGEVDLELPGEVDLEPPGEVDLEPPGEVDLELPGEVDLEPPGEVDLESSKDSLLEYITKLLPETKKPQKSSSTSFPKGPSFYQRTPSEVHKFCKWINDTFGDLGIDEEYIVKQFEIDHECTPTYNTVKIKKVSQIPLEIKYSKQLDKIKERKFSLQEESWERKLRKRQDPYKPKRVKIRYGAWYLKPSTWKKLINDEPLIDPKVLREQEYQNYKRYLEPGIIDELYGPIAFKDFIISKGYRMPGVLKKLFFRKGWTYDSVKTPFHRVMKLLSKSNNEEEEEEDV
uniref:Protein FAM47E n=1 Tax=Molossus molossus TaxID=27622 RepID=A0A7J8J7R6_MOLMO|nr:hypothetical protein HJG59_009682 [Molossus molossus]